MNNPANSVTPKKRSAPSAKARRPRLDPDKRRSVVVAARVTPEEYERIVIQAGRAGLSPSAFVASAALKKRTPAKQKSDSASVDLARQLQAIGNNLNQIAHIANRSKRIPAGLHKVQDDLTAALMKVIGQ